MGNATRRAFTRIIDLCLEEAVDALLIAGDLYDGDQTSMKTARFLALELKRLHDAGIRCFIIRGNHDNLSRITRELSLPDSVKVFGSRASVEMVARAGGQPIAIHGLSFAEAQMPDSLLPKYRPPVADAVNIGLLHTSLGGSPGHDAYAPCSLADLQASGFRYWALGHIHARSVVEGPVTVVMPGMPQGRDINEAGPKSVTLVTVADDGTLSLAERPTSIAVFERATVDLTGATDWPNLARLAARRLTELHAASAGPDIIGRLSFTGITPLAWRIRRDMDLLAEEVRIHAEGRGTWLEKLATSCRVEEPSAAQQSADVRADNAGTPLAALQELAREVIATPSYRLEATEVARDLIDRLPAELRDLLGADDAAEAASLEALAAEGVADVIARLESAHPDEAA